MKNLLSLTLFCCLMAACSPGMKKGVAFPETGVTFTTSDLALQQVFDRAETLAAANIRQYTPRYKVMVEGGEYPYVWVETQPMGGVMYGKRDLRIAHDNVTIFLNNQLPNGRIGGKVVALNNNVWGASPLVEREDSTIGVFAETLQGYFVPPAALDLYYLLGRDEAYLDLLYNSFEAYDNYLWSTRDSDGDGCLEAWCETDAGEDHLTRFRYSPFFWPFDYPPTPENIPNDTVFFKQYGIKYDLEGFAIEKIPVPMESIDMMCFSYTGRDALAVISALKGNGKEAYWRQKADEVRQRMLDYLWVPEKNAYFFRDKNNSFIESLTHNNLRAMYFGTMMQPMADAFVREHLLNPDEFWTPMPLPSIAANDPYFQNIPQNNWSGQPEGLTYQRAIRALENYGHLAEVTLIGQKLLAQIQKSGIYTQQFDPFTGEQNGLDGYGPTILSTLEYISRLYGVHLHRDEVHFNGIAAEAPYTYTQKWGDKTFALSQSEGKLTGSLNGKTLFECTAGVRVTTDLDGAILAITGITDKPVNLTLLAEGKEYSAVVYPNEQLAVEVGNLASVKRVPFDYPYQKQPL